MNRLILLGNGFDLAHGLPTSYEDFIFNICKQEILYCLGHTLYRNGNVTRFLDPKIIHKFDTKLPRGNIYNLIKDKINNKYDLTELLSNKKNWIDFYSNETIESVTHQMSVIKCSNSFAFNLVTENNGKNWSDIESYFYSKLIECFGIKNANDPIIKDKDEILKEVKTLNEEFREVTFALGYYLTKYVEEKYKFEAQKEFINILSGNEQTKSTLLLNFNYTQTADMYLPYLQKNNPSELIQIHGKLDRFRDNPIIFGFGDEYDNTYKLLENFNDNSLFYHIKSFGYFKSNNYRNMESFVESDPYEIFIIGHSCGLSDRTLLKYLFEHNNCKSIKIYHYQDPEKDFFKSINNYISVTQEISRHFGKKAAMRSKIVPFNERDFCPQVKLEKIG